VRSTNDFVPTRTAIQLTELGLSDRVVEELNRVICGTQTVEGAPGLRDEHLPVFDCANRCGKIGRGSSRLPATSA
jgi:hypothetical protein